MSTARPTIARAADRAMLDGILASPDLERFVGGHGTCCDLLPRTIANRFGRDAPRRA